jgi:hypothetical protein
MDIHFSKPENISWDKFNREQSGYFSEMRGVYTSMISMDKINYEQIGKYFEDCINLMISDGILKKKVIE